MKLITEEIIEKRLKKASHNSHAGLPGNTGFRMDDDSGVLTVELSDKGLGLEGTKSERNMYKDHSAFEAWALLLKTYLRPSTVQLTCRRSELPSPRECVGQDWAGQLHAVPLSGHEIRSGVRRVVSRRRGA